MHQNVFIHFLFHLLPPRHLFHHYLSQQQIVSILVFMHLCLHTFPFSPTSSTTSYSPLSVTTTACKYSCVYASKCIHTFPFSPTSSTTSYSPLQQQEVSILMFMNLSSYISLSPTSSMTSYSPLSVTKQEVSYYCVYESSLLCLHTFPFSPTSSTTSYSPLSVTKQEVSYYCVYESSLLCLHTFPFSPTSSMTSYSPLPVATTDCKYYCVYASKCLNTFPFSPTSSTTSYSPLSVIKQRVSILVFMNLVFYVFIHFLFHLLPPRHLIHHYLSQNRK